MDNLVADILGLADALGYECFHLAGHDFGAMVSWNLAMQHPQRVRRLAIANVPHPDVMKKYLRSHLSQILKSWYAIFFQIPALPERMVRAANWKFLISAMPDDLSPERRDQYRAAWEHPGAITGMINWYRATFRQMGNSAGSHRIQTPTLMLWGKQDPHLSYEMAQLSLDLCEEGRLVTFEDATHWVLYDKSAEVSRHLIEHFLKKD
jgi:pimeloyl-ACP methyl ester carboxylesterase